MKSLLKTLIVCPSIKKYTAYRDLYFSLLKDRDKHFTDLSEFIFDWKQEFDLIPTFSAIKKELTETQETALLNYVVELEQDSSLIVFTEDSEFLVHIKKVEKILFESDVFGCVAKFQQEIKTNPIKDLDSICKPVEELISGLHKSKNKVLRTESSTAGLLYGEESIQQLQEIYEGIVNKKKEDDFIYYTFGFKKFESVKITKGDLIVIGGFTSHGKSMLLRNLIYRLLIEYKLNCYYCSLEMSYEKMKLLFLALHANNKDLPQFAGTPKIPYEKIKEGNLTPEEKDFVFNVVAKDFYGNEDYGTLFLEYPNKSRYRMSDIKSRITELENTVMPIHAVAIDYLTMLYPLESDKGSPDRQDYNQIVKDFKNMALSHRKVDGSASPFIAITPAQISRGGLENAMKNNNYYDLSALREYSELESSADIVMTTMLLPDMRERKVIALQNLKNRDGRVETEIVELACDLDCGFNIKDEGCRKDSAQIAALKSLKI